MVSLTAGWGRRQVPPDAEDALREFRAYQRELAAARQEVQGARLARDRGEVRELDIDELIEIAEKRLCVRGKV